MPNLPKFSVCPSCEGEGYVGTLGAYTADEFYEAFEDMEEYSAIHEASKVACDACKGLRVVTAEQIAEWEDDCQYRAEMAAERRAGC